MIIKLEYSYLFKKKKVQGKNDKPDYEYKMHHYFESVSDEILNYILNSNVKINF